MGSGCGGCGDDGSDVGRTPMAKRLVNGTPFAISTVNGKIVAVAGPDEFVPLVLKSNERIKWTGPDRTSTWGLTDYPQIGRWSKAREPIICESGWHTTITGQVQDWVQAEAWLVRTRGTNVVKESKEVHEQILFIRRLHFDPVAYAQACADRAKIHAESAIAGTLATDGADPAQAAENKAAAAATARWAASMAARARAAEWPAAAAAMATAAAVASAETAAVWEAERQWQNDWLMDHFDDEKESKQCN